MSSVLFNPKGLFFETKTWEKVRIFGLKNLDARGQSPTTECQDCQLSSWKLQGLYDQNLCYLGKTWLAEVAILKDDENICLFFNTPKHRS